MRCKNCNYRLWNLRSRSCPECGTPFRPSEYEFAVNTVQFCCPHCGQDYYGTGEKGHLRPFQFNCVRCKNLVSMDEMVCLPTSGVEEEETQIEHMPWFDRRRTALRRWTGTIRMALLQPGELLRVTPQDSSLGQAWGFFLITWLATALLASGVLCIIPLVVALSAPGNTGPGASTAILGALAFGAFSATLGTLVGVVLWTLAAHGLLLLTGGTQFGVRRTQQAMLYASGANVITAIPCFGSYFGWIWWIVSSILALKEAQRINGWRASFAILGFPLLLIVAVVGFYIWLIFAFIAAGTTAGTWAPQTGAVQGLASAIQTYAAAHNGAGPAHPVELLQSDPTLTPLDFIVAGETPPETVSFGTTTLNLYDSLDDRQQRAAIAAAAASAPPTPTPQKFGDFIFVYAGLNLGTCPPDSWVVIHERHAPPNSGGIFVTGWYEVGLANGATLAYPASAFPPLLLSENARRASLGAPLIPGSFFAATSQPVSTQPAGSRPADAGVDEP